MDIERAIKALKEFPRVFGEVVRKKRLKSGITQDELSKLLNKVGVQVSQSYISLLEVGQRADPNIKVVIAISSLLDISLDQLFSNEERGN